tara:strand:- start:1531 stop:1662 length:132 start_codon:yes stop_codon:yes gene_type:complete
MRYLGAIVIAMVVLFPLAGASLIVVLIADRLLQRLGWLQALPG